MIVKHFIKIYIDFIFDMKDFIFDLKKIIFDFKAFIFNFDYKNILTRRPGGPHLYKHKEYS